MENISDYKNLRPVYNLAGRKGPMYRHIFLIDFENKQVMWDADIKKYLKLTNQTKLQILTYSPVFFICNPDIPEFSGKKDRWPFINIAHCKPKNDIPFLKAYTNII